MANSSISQTIEAAADLENMLSPLRIEEVEREVQIGPTEFRQAVYTHRTSPGPISKLPSEVLLLIFHLCIPAPMPRQAFCAFTSLAFSQTCSRWRKLALGDSSLWCSPIFHRPRLAQEMIARTTGRPLVVAATDFYAHHTVLRKTLTNIDVETLELVVNNLDRLESLLELALGRSLQTLRHLDLELRPSNNTTESPYLKTVSGNMLLRRLCKLRLHGCLLPLTSGCFSNLTWLEIDLSSRRLLSRSSVEGSMDITTILKVLRRNRGLEQLSLIEVGKAAPDHFPIAKFLRGLPEPLTLPHLKRLKLYQQQSSVLLRILRALDLPALSHLDIHASHSHYANDGTDYDHELLRCIADKITAAISHCSIQDFIYTIDDPTVLFKATCATLNAREAFTLHVQLGKYTTCLHELPRFFHLEELQSFTMLVANLPVTVELHPLWDCLASLPEVAKISVCQSAYSGIVEVLAKLVSAPNAPLPFPSLQKLVIDSAPMDNWELLDGLKITGLRRFAMCLHLLKAKRGGSLPEITLWRCSVRTPARKVFEKFNVDVEVKHEEVKLSRDSRYSAFEAIGLKRWDFDSSISLEETEMDLLARKVIDDLEDI